MANLRARKFGLLFVVNLLLLAGCSSDTDTNAESPEPVPSVTANPSEPLYIAGNISGTSQVVTPSKVSEPAASASNLKRPACTKEFKDSQVEQLKAALFAAKAGDTLCLREGTFALNAMDVKATGTAAKPVTLMGYPGENAKLVQAGVDQWVLKFKEARHVHVLDLEFSGRDLTTAASDDDVAAGLLFEDSNHVVVSNLNVHHFGNGGITTIRTNNVLLEHNESSFNGRASCSQASGLNVHTPQNSPNPEYSEDFEIIIRNNVAYGNANQRTPVDPWHATRTANGWYLATCERLAGLVGDYQNATTDGNCIIIDLAGAWDGNVLIENNLCYDNGGRGVAMTKSDNAVIRNNTFYRNLVPHELFSPGSREAITDSGEILLVASKNVTIENNIFWPIDADRSIAGNLEGNTVGKNVIATNNSAIGFIEPGKNFGLAADAPARKASSGAKL